MFKIDKEKTYDRVDWDILQWTMGKKGFGEKWTKWITGCLDHPHYSVMINGISKSLSIPPKV